MKKLAWVGAAAATCILMGPVVSTSAWAQQRQKVSFDVPAEGAKFTQQHTIDVGDMPGHQVRIFEIKRVYGKNAPLIEGQRLKESWTRGMSDYTELNGGGQVYVTYVAETGDKIYAHGYLTSHAAVDSASKTTSKSLAALMITGGTGKLAGIRGVVRSEISTNAVAGISVSKADMEYWMEK